MNGTIEKEQTVATEILKKPYARQVVPEQDGSFRAEILEFPGCIALGDTQADALRLLEEVASDWIDAALENGQAIPEPIETNAGFSGKLVLRLPKGLHRKAVYMANREGVSLNQFIVTALAIQVGEATASSVVVGAQLMNASVVGVGGYGNAFSGTIGSFGGALANTSGGGIMITNLSGGVGTSTSLILNAVSWVAPVPQHKASAHG